MTSELRQAGIGPNGCHSSDLDADVNRALSDVTYSAMKPPIIQ